MDKIFVMHTWVDTDGCGAAAAARAYFKKVSPEDKVKVAFVPQGKTFRGIELHLERNYELYTFPKSGETVEVYHFDCGGEQSVFDHHRNNCDGKSSLEVVAHIFNFEKTMPEWLPIVHIVNLADQGKLRGLANIQTLLQGLREQDFSDLEIYREMEKYFLTLVAREKAVLLVEEIPWDKVENLTPLPKSGPFIVSKKVEGFGTIGVARMSKVTHLGKVRGRLRDCRVIITQCKFRGETHYGIFGNKDCLAELKLVQIVRMGEAKKRKLPMPTKVELAQKGEGPNRVWFVFDGHHGKGQGAKAAIISLLHGSPKTVIEKGQKTAMTFDFLVRLVEDHCRKYAEREQTKRG